MVRTESKNQRTGFTLIELLIVIGLLGVLAAIAAPMAIRHFEGVRTTADEATVKILNETTALYQIEEKITEGDIFAGIEDDSERMEQLVTRGYIREAVSPRQKDTEFAWHIISQSWIYRSTLNDVEYPDWTDSTTYLAGDTVVYDGRIFEARTWTQNQIPGDTDSPWQEITGEWRGFNVYFEDDVVLYEGAQYQARNWTQNAVPGLITSPWQEITDEWRSFNIYQAGNIVVHNSTHYRAKWYTQNEEPGISSAWQVID